MTSWGFVLLSLALVAGVGWIVHLRWQPVRLGPRDITIAATLAAIGTLTAHVLWIPTGVAKAFPVQHAINVLAGVLLGPVPAAMVAFVVAVLRNLLGTGTLLAFPGGMIGAFLAGSLYGLTRRVGWAVAGEVFGTGILGGLAAYPVVVWVMGHPAAPFFYVVPFLMSSAAGAALAYALLTVLRHVGFVGERVEQR